MPERAKITSLEALESFRARLIVYREKASRVLDEVSDEVTRTRLWLETDRPTYWQNQIRRLSRELEQAQQELFSAQLSGLRDASINQQVAVQKLRRSIRAAEDKTKTIKQWQRQYRHAHRNARPPGGEATPLPGTRSQQSHQLSERSHQEHRRLCGINAGR
ncbi:MAG: hypothetical protein QM813_12550 [Verrucomicrobiota bacterium]